MAEWAPKRFWTETGIAPEGAGWGVRLDGRAIRTPAKAPLALPSRALAEAVAAEWAAQDEVVRPATMPFTRSANSAIDRVAPQFDEVAGIVAAYGESDLICYRAEAPEGLVAAQAEAWDPFLALARGRFGAPLVATVGVMHVAQPEGSVAALRAAVEALDPFVLTALHDLAALSGSLVMGLAVLAGEVAPQAAWEASRTDEAWQASQWGEDAGAAEVAALKRAEFLHAARFHALAAAAE